MRFNNSKSKQFVILTYFILVVLIIFLSFFYNIFSNVFRFNKIENLLLIVTLVISFLLVQKIAKYFEYDSDGNVLVFENKGFLLSEFFRYGKNKAEFPKKKLLYYKLNNYVLYKSLNLYIKSSEKKQKRIRFNITLVSDKKIKYLKQSLDKVLKQNKTEA